MSSKTLSSMVMILIGLLGFLVLIMISTLFSLFLLGTNQGADDMKRVLKEYRYLRIPPSTSTSDEYVTGTVKHPKIPEDYLFYEDSDGSQILISEFGSNEYKCTGICYCEDEYSTSSEETITRKSITSRLGSKPLTYLVAAATSSLAFTLARKYFEDECPEQNQQLNCPNSILLSETDSCEEITEPVEYPHKDMELEMFGEEGYEEYTDLTIIYLCKGTCLYNIYEQETPHNMLLQESEIWENEYWSMGHVNEQEKEFILENGKCEKLSLETEIWIDPAHENYLSPGEEEDKVKIKTDRAYQDQMAKERFLNYNLEEFCIRNSIKHIPFFDIVCDHGAIIFDTKCYEEYEVHGTYEKCETCEHGMKIPNSKPLCVSHDNSGMDDIFSDGTDMFDENESVVCRRMERKTKMYREQDQKS